MTHRAIAALLTLAFLPASGGATETAPRVVADIPAIHSLVAGVMEGRGTPDLLMSGASSPHDFALKPSQASAIERADLIVWTSAGLTPWLDDALDTLADDGVALELMALAGTERLPLRQDAQKHDEEGHDEHDHDKDHAHDHAHDHEDEHAHDHGDIDYDPHGWLYIDNAILWTAHITETLALADPEFADHYRANGAAVQANLRAQFDALGKLLEPVKDKRYMTLHDAFQYFEHAFDLGYSGSILLGDAAPASPARVAHAREIVQERQVQCLFSEPQQSTRLAEVVIEGTDARLAVLDAIGAGLTPGPLLYAELMDGLVNSMTDCLGD